MKQNVVAYLAKDGVTEKEFIDKSSRPHVVEINERSLNAKLYLKNTNLEPRWISLFEQVDVPERFKKQKTLRGLLVLETNNRLMAITFGHGRSMINQSSIVRGFGLRVAMNLGDPKKLKSIDKSTLDKVALNTRSQSAKNTGVEDFGFEFDHEVLRSLTAVVDSEEDDTEIVSGSDSVTLSTDITFDTIQSIADRLFDAYSLEEYKTVYPWVEYIYPETDPTIKEKLDEKIVGLLNAGNLEELWIAPPEIIDYSDFSGFVYRRTNPPVFYQELNLSTFISDSRFRGDISVSSLKSKKIYVYNGEEAEVNQWPIFRCLNGEIDLDGKRYILNDGRWYQIQQTFYDEVCEYFNSLDHAGLQFDPYGGRKEGPYLRAIANNNDLVLLDQKWVRPKGVANNLEFCDLLSDCNGIIHVKKYGSSAVLNHLFAQAYQSIEMLINSPEVIEQVNQHLNESPLSLVFDAEESPRRHRIVLAIMDHRAGDLDIPFFAKVNLRQHSRKMRGMGFSVELAKIEMGDQILDEEPEAEDVV